MIYLTHLVKIKINKMNGTREMSVSIFELDKDPRASKHNFRKYLEKILSTSVNILITRWSELITCDSLG